MKTKVIKNEDSPMGRDDWKGRTPRWRPSWFLPKFLILKECMEETFNRHPERRTTREYAELYDEICGIVQKMQTPLTATVDDFSLLDEEIRWD